jgi:hypothetical protein
MDNQCGGHTIPKLLKAHSAVVSTDSIATFLPWWEWSTGTPYRLTLLTSRPAHEKGWVGKLFAPR